MTDSLEQLRDMIQEARRREAETPLRSMEMFAAQGWLEGLEFVVGNWRWDDRVADEVQDTRRALARERAEHPPGSSPQTYSQAYLKALLEGARILKLKVK